MSTAGRNEVLTKVLAALQDEPGRARHFREWAALPQVNALPQSVGQCLAKLASPDRHTGVERVAAGIYRFREDLVVPEEVPALLARGDLLEVLTMDVEGRLVLVDEQGRTWFAAAARAGQ